MHQLNFLFLLFLLPVLTVAQTATDDFEGNGTITTWFGDDCVVDLAYANPFVEAINTSATVLRYEDQGGPYANLRFQIDEPFGLAQNATFSLKIYVPAASTTGDQPYQIALKLQNGSLAEPWTTQTEIIKPITPDQWQTVVFDFATDDYQNFDPASPDPLLRMDLNRVVIQVNGENNNDLVTAYLDDFYYFAEAGPGTIYTELVWADEFDVNGPIDATKWHHQTQLPSGGSWFNNELQHYTDRTENSFVEDGNLHVVARRETFTDQGYTKNYTSARLNSKFAFTYGRVEARAKLPTGVGTWPAIWMLGKNITEAGGYWAATHGTTPWPACGEIDIMEHWGNNQNYVQSALHTPSSFGATVNHGGLYDEDVSDAFHVYAMEWSPEAIRFSIDGQEFYVYAPADQNPDTWPFTADQYLLLNVAMQGDVDPAFTESPMVIDYIRVYQEPTNSTGEREEDYDIQIYPNPAAGPLQVTVPEALVGARMRVLSADGRTLVSEHAQTARTTTLDWSAYPAGTYCLVFELAGERVVRRVVKG